MFQLSYKRSKLDKIHSTVVKKTATFYAIFSSYGNIVYFLPNRPGQRKKGAHKVHPIF